VVEHRERATDVLSDEIESASGPYEHLGIVRGRLDRPPNEIERFAPVGLGILGPAARHELAGAPRRADERAAVVGIARDGLAKQIQPLERGLLASAAHQRPRAEIEVESGQIGGRARSGAADFRFLQRRFDHAGHAERDFVLQLEDVLHRAVESVASSASSS
jgi:hypothetical protein